MSPKFYLIFLMTFAIILLASCKDSGVSKRGKSHDSSDDNTGDSSGGSDSSDSSYSDERFQYIDRREVRHLLKCHKRNEFYFVMCYSNIKILLKKDKADLAPEEFDDYKCALLNALVECLQVKTGIYCGREIKQVMQSSNSTENDLQDNERAHCNKTGVVEGHAINFSV